ISLNFLYSPLDINTAYTGMIYTLDGGLTWSRDIIDPIFGNYITSSSAAENKTIYFSTTAHIFKRTELGVSVLSTFNLEPSFSYESINCSRNGKYVVYIGRNGAM